MPKNSASRWKGWRTSETQRAGTFDNKRGISKKRKKKRKRGKRSSGGAPPPDTWWLTFVGQDRHCDRCGERARGNPVVYQHSTGTVYCTVCADDLGIRPRESKRYRKATTVTSVTSAGGKQSRRRSKRRADNRTGPRPGPYRVGERHRAWPEWTWDGEAFRRSED